jgi:hypothetical protein
MRGFGQPAAAGAVFICFARLGSSAGVLLGRSEADGRLSGGDVLVKLVQLLA